MLNVKVAGVIFSNSNDNALKELTSMRSMASLPFGCRYRLIDFTLSSFVNAGINNIGIITSQNYRSLMDHVGSGIYWDLDRKNGGLSIVPPFISGKKEYKGDADAANRALEYVNRHPCDYVVLCESGIVANVDVQALINYTVEKGADVTLLYRESETADKFSNTLSIKLDSDNKVTEISDAKESKNGGNLTVGYVVFTREAFVELVLNARESSENTGFSTIFAKIGSKFKVYGFKHSGYIGIMDSRKAYFENTMKLLDEKVRNDLFRKDRPIFTKVKDDMPTRYGTHSSVENSIIADGCVIDGTVKNCVLFRGVRVKKGAVVENSILMQGVEVRENSTIKYIVSDKNAVIGGKEPIKGTDHKAFLIKKNQVFTN